MSVAFTVTDRLTGDDFHVAVPDGLHTLDDFRRWVATESIPEKLKLRFHRGMVEVRAIAEDVETHSLLKGDLIGQLGAFVRANNLGRIFSSGTLLTNDEAQSAYEPDLMFCRFETLQEKHSRVRAFLALETASNYAAAPIWSSRSSASQAFVRTRSNSASRTTRRGSRSIGSSTRGAKAWS